MLDLHRRKATEKNPDTRRHLETDLHAGSMPSISGKGPRIAIFAKDH